MRRFLAIVIAVLVGLPAVSPLFALGGGVDPNLPACCRRDGKHHCMLMDMDAGDATRSALASSGKLGFQSAALSERCPYGSKGMPGTGRADWTINTAKAVFAGLAAHPCGLPQTESKRRISADRSRQKRGPPAAFAC